MEGLVLYGPIADSTAYCQVAKTNIPSPLATTDADSEPKEQMVSNGQSETAGDDDVGLQAVGAGPPQEDQKAVNPRVQINVRNSCHFHHTILSELKSFLT